MSQLDVTIRCNHEDAKIPTPEVMYRIIRFTEMQMGVRSRDDVKVEYNTTVMGVRASVTLLDIEGKSIEGKSSE